jgi:hypothetical protein
MTLAQFGGFLLATFLFALGLVLAVRNPVHFIANAAARLALFPLALAIVVIAAGGLWIALRLHGV